MRRLVHLDLIEQQRYDNGVTLHRYDERRGGPAARRRGLNDLDVTHCR